MLRPRRPSSTIKVERYTADDAEEMIGKLTGMPIPLNSLRQWILGLPGDATDYKLDDQYRLSEITYSQNGKNWKVVYGGYEAETSTCDASQYGTHRRWSTHQVKNG